MGNLIGDRNVDTLMQDDDQVAFVGNEENANYNEEKAHRQVFSS